MYSKSYIICFGILTLVLLCSSDATDETIEPLDETDDTPYTVEIVSLRSSDKPSILLMTIDCIGGILGEKFIVTAASCVINAKHEFDNNDLLVQYNVKDFENPLHGSQKTALIEKIYVPRTYNATTLKDNIAVLKLGKSLKLEKIGLRKLDIPKESPKVGDNAEIATSGIAHILLYPSNDTVETLYNIRANTKVVDKAECEKIYPNSVGNVNLCAKLDEPDRSRFRCYVKNKISHPGSVLTVGRKTLIGLLSHESRVCNKTQDLQMYTDVFSQADFINNAIHDRTDNMTVTQYT